MASVTAFKACTFATGTRPVARGPRPTQSRAHVRAAVVPRAKYGDDNKYFDLNDLENTIGSWELYGHEEKARYPSIQGEFFQRAAAGLTRREYLLAFVAGLGGTGLLLWGGIGSKATQLPITKGPQQTPQCKTVEPGTVKEYKRHILMRVPLEKEGPADQAWPRTVESLSSIEPLARALKTASKDGTVVGPVMVSAYEALGDGPQEADCADILLLPDNVQLRGVPLSDLTAVAMDSLSRPGAWEAGEETHGVAWAALPPLTLLVCCHNARDERCGVLGPQLAARLEELLLYRGFAAAQFRVLKVSHVGQHIYAGNVIAYRPGHPGHGDWYGGVHAENAEAWLTAWLGTPAELDGGVGDPALRPHWRGRLGLSKEEQLAVFEAGKALCAGKGGADIEELCADVVQTVQV
ncbi:Photosystem I reaction center subunit VI, chloroplastic [Auxenochlorella protothecoides]|uniref:Photosystem I reaction center subunit VI, chloroplastic n=1 Tax=Auxenochlorella protothecoides TaxID=3075 RepID=A0A087SLX0_AUXPR|nr:Photosystem I reaction center subunit VI, chloroplastic [Auxenochlorella protothecoides]KFM26724.1 Photosystem I reaction center subunit VI, chloroplastic [Auxenochlorella protothecoides]